jgi:hypothetical protein
LPAPEGEAYAHRQYVAPQGQIERALAQMWQELLCVERVGRHDTFFELGGHSLLALQVCRGVRQAFGVELKVSKMFANPSVAQLAEQISLEVAEDVEEGTL